MSTPQQLVSVVVWTIVALVVVLAPIFGVFAMRLVRKDVREQFLEDERQRMFKAAEARRLQHLAEVGAHMKELRGN